jgi:hypothetical protein
MQNGLQPGSAEMPGIGYAGPLARSAGREWYAARFPYWYVDTANRVSRGPRVNIGPRFLPGDRSHDRAGLAESAK